MDLNLFLVTAFSNTIGKGNPAGVVFAPASLSADHMQAIAAEINYSETAFITKTTPQQYNIRWFTPNNEVPLCGHATMAAAKVIFTQNPEINTIDFLYQGGLLNVSRQENESIEMVFPLDKVQTIPIKSAYLSFFHLDHALDCIVGLNTKKVVLILDDEVNLDTIQPDFAQMKAYRGAGDRGIGLSKRSQSHDFESRYFNPWYGVNEDPVTGTVHTVLANYWSQQLGKTELFAIQKSPRSGELSLVVQDQNTVKISGQASIFLQGIIHI